MAKKENITSNFIRLKALAILFFIVGPYIFFNQNEKTIQEAILGLILVWGIASLFWIYAITRNKVYYDKEKFYIYDWKGKEIDIVANEQITSMLYSGFGGNTFGWAFRLFYDSEKGNKKEFWIFPSFNINILTIQERLKKINPALLTTHFSFGGIEHLFIRNEDGFR